MTPASESYEEQIFALREQLRRENDENDAEDESGSMSVDSMILTATIVPAMNELLKDPNNLNIIIEEKKDGSETTSKKDDKSRVDYVSAILECMVSFVAATCSPGSDSQVVDSPTQQTSYNSLSFKRSTTPKKKKKPAQKSMFSSNPSRDKELFMACGAFEMAISVLRQLLEEYVSKASADSWSRNKNLDLDTFDSIGVADSSADVKIESTMPENEIPALVMHMIACLTHNANDMIKSDVLPHLTPIIHKSMMVFLPSPEVQAYGCWTLYNLSNPLLQEMIAAGSVSVLVRAMKCHHTDTRVQEHGNKSLYNLLHLLVYCTDHSEHSESSSFDHDSPKHQKSVISANPTSMLIEIDGEKLEDYSSLLPSLPSVVIRGMEFHSDHLDIQQYGLLVLTRLCQQDKEKYEVVVSEGGLTALLHVVTMATKAKLELQMSGTNPNDDFETRKKNADDAEKYDCLAQMACQFLRDMSRPTNSSMDILRIIAVKGGMKTVLKLLDHYNEENMKCGGYGSSDYYGNSQKFAIINIIDPAMACLRNLMTNEDNRREVMTFLAIAKTMEQEQQSSGNTVPFGDDDDGILVCANLIPIVLKTMDAYPLDAPIQAYGCDLLGRLAQGEQSARMELIHTTIDSDALSSNGQDDVEVAYLSDQMKNSVISTSPRSYKKKVDALETVIRAMKNHRTHQGAQERTVTFILALVIDRDAVFNKDGNTSGTSTASFYLIQRLQEVYQLHRGQNDPPTFLAYLQRTTVPPKGVERLKTLIQFVEDYDRRKAGNDPNASNRMGSIRQRLLGGWTKPGQ
uniref:Uncharacterized protein n=1 Tax=Pseudo-nitzschia delicatissima TaxID=44447 RepID=A0A7S0T9S5_9STRA|mmetsp:Transcript_579/g.1291  ORF Transcript_579/g.1291 Transcript_579/m.1291 type:complete len:798 (+) Transcript_579:114-2507(+)|eukprot:CAMPEP_0116101696 /NCGR_PEP_ID=MMETSP0327-20121206/12947_1 /TAXON_ID=44447 /ORGANISM="Pseudo-nitzschia delicatissima, Strain B596" /LENGTH=797 /DNA_ID=CAMNT_0003593673 /DNA_START=44 /DNA_END=2440 /DNA_ORIENTATION=+